MARIRKKDLKRDEFKETIENILIFYQHHKKTVLWSAVGIVVVLILFLSYRSNKNTKIEKSKEMYNIGVILYNNSNYEQAKQRFQMVTRNYRGTVFANRSTYMLANISYKEGNLDEALERFQTFVNGKYDEFFTPSAYQGIAQCYEQKGNLNKAIENYKTAASKFKDNIFKADCLLHLAALYLSTQKLDESEESYEKIFGITENAELLALAEKKLKLIQVQRELNE